jgi:hypothetical protein
MKPPLCAWTAMVAAVIATGCAPARAPQLVAPAPPVAMAPPPAPTSTPPPAPEPPPPREPVTLADLPLLSTDGRVVAAVLMDGYMTEDWSSALVLVDARKDRVRETIALELHDEEDREKPRSRTAAANARLAAARWLHPTALHLADDPAVPVRIGGVGGESHGRIGQGEGLTVRYAEPRFTVRREEDGATLADLDARRWSKTGARKGEPPCGWLAQMDGLWYEPSHRVLVVLVGYYGGSDTCGEPAQAVHVVRLPRRAGPSAG